MTYYNLDNYDNANLVFSKYRAPLEQISSTFGMGTFFLS